MGIVSVCWYWLSCPTEGENKITLSFFFKQQKNKLFSSLSLQWRGACWVCWWMCRCCLWWRDSPLICVTKTYDALSTCGWGPFYFTCSVQLSCHMIYSHGHFSVVQEILHWVHARELVEDLRPIGDHTCGGVYRGDAAGDVDKLDVWEVRKCSTSDLVAYLLIREAHITLKSVCRFLSCRWEYQILQHDQRVPNLYCSIKQFSQTTLSKLGVNLSWKVPQSYFCRMRWMFHLWQIWILTLVGQRSSQQSQNTQVCWTHYWGPSETHCKELGTLGKDRCSGPYTPCHRPQLCHCFLGKTESEDENQQKWEYQKQQLLEHNVNDMPPTWRSVCVTNNTGIRYLSLDP